ncbi:hypothetical protein PLESTF_000813800 [Pleodorina starrii]|nr:hypothetical protein PLESTM_001334600 [Pleodorina starrii]GLC69305.1 hypothetical protein PLESTF_000813800 [Pleodorina starrii]
MHSLLGPSQFTVGAQRCANQKTTRRSSPWQQQQQHQGQRPQLLRGPAAPCSTEAPSAASVAPANTSTAASAAAKPADVVTVFFRQEGTSTEARPGEDFMEAASRCGADIPTGCLHGSCGVCEVELFKYGPDGREAGSPVVMRACVAKVPRGWGRVEVGMMSADSVWGQDGWDT